MLFLRVPVIGLYIVLALTTILAFFSLLRVGLTHLPWILFWFRPERVEESVFIPVSALPCF
jgi:hypothetical protein